jgi:hypothetical protein
LQKNKKTMEITGKIIQILEPLSGTSARGEWKRQDFIIETQDQYPKKVCISNWNNKANLEQMGVGTIVTASINIESREYNGRWYTDVKVWKMEAAGQNQTTQQQNNTQGSTPPPPVEPPMAESEDDDMPF